MRLNYYDKEILRSIRDTIAAGPDIHYNIEDLALMAGMSATRLKTAFRKQYGITMYQFSIQQRMQLAKLLIEDDKKSLASIAKETGFRYLSNFIAAFKKHYGYTPGSLKP